MQASTLFEFCNRRLTHLLADRLQRFLGPWSPSGWRVPVSPAEHAAEKGQFGQTA
jgi:hypothetical protein